MYDYYDIAYNDYLFMRGAERTKQYNNLCTQAQQIAEKLLKSVAENVIPPDSKNLMNGHNLRLLYREIRKAVPEFKVKSESDLVALKDMYYDVRYPGENYFIATEDQYIESVETVEDIIQQVNLFRKANDLPVKDFQAPDSFEEEATAYLGDSLAEDFLRSVPSALKRPDNIKELVDIYIKTLKDKQSED